MTCLFCSLYQEQKNSIIYETDNVYVIHDRFPVSKGHMLVIPKRHGEFLHSYEPQELTEIIPVIMHLVKTLGIKKYNIVQNNGHIQEIMHLHFHIVPYQDEEKSLKLIPYKIKLNDDEYMQWVKEFKNKLC